MHSNHKRCSGEHGHRRGPTSYRMHDSELVFETLSLAEGSSFLDLGCGPGDYSIHAAKIVGNQGRVYAMDQYRHVLETVDRQAAEHGLGNIHTLQQDMTDYIPLLEQSVDTCFLSTSLHCLDFKKQAPPLFREIEKALRDNGTLAILECKKQQMNFGPPLHMRISAEDIAEMIDGKGFRRADYVDLGVNYLVLFTKTGESIA